MRSILIAGLVSALPFTAMAQGFHGPYVGAELGYSETKVKFLDDQGGFGLDDDGLRFGGIVGYRQNTNGFVWGVEGRIGDSDNKISVTDGGETVSLSSGFEWSINGILGYAVSDSVLLFGTAGYANARAKGNVTGEQDSKTLDGIRYGLGVEFAVTGSISLRGVASRSDYGKLLNAQDEADIGGNLKLKQNQFDAGLIFSF